MDISTVQVENETSISNRQMAVIDPVIRLMRENKWSARKSKKDCLFSELNVSYLPLTVYRIEKKIHHSLDTIKTVLCDERLPNMKAIDNLLEGVTILENQDGVELQHLAYKKPAALASPRDFLVYNTNVCLNRQDQEILQLPKVCDDLYIHANRSAMDSIRRPKKNVIRSYANIFAYVAYQESRNVTNMTLYVCVNPAGSVPSWAVTAGVTEQATKVKSIINLCSKARVTKPVIGPAPIRMATPALAPVFVVEYVVPPTTTTAESVLVAEYSEPVIEPLTEMGRLTSVLASAPSSPSHHREEEEEYPRQYLTSLTNRSVYTEDLCTAISMDDFDDDDDEDDGAITDYYHEADGAEKELPMWVTDSHAAPPVASCPSPLVLSLLDDDYHNRPQDDCDDDEDEEDEGVAAHDVCSSPGAFCARRKGLPRATSAEEGMMLSDEEDGDYDGENTSFNSTTVVETPAAMQLHATHYGEIQHPKDWDGVHYRDRREHSVQYVQQLQRERLFHQQTWKAQLFNLGDYMFASPSQRGQVIEMRYSKIKNK